MECLGCRPAHLETLNRTFNIIRRLSPHREHALGIELNPSKFGVNIYGLKSGFFMFAASKKHQFSLLKTRFLRKLLKITSPRRDQTPFGRDGLVQSTSLNSIVKSAQPPYLGEALGGYATIGRGSAGPEGTRRTSYMSRCACLTKHLRAFSF